MWMKRRVVAYSDIRSEAGKNEIRAGPSDFKHALLISWKSDYRAFVRPSNNARYRNANSFLPKLADDEQGEEGSRKKRGPEQRARSGFIPVTLLSYETISAGCVWIISACSWIAASHFHPYYRYTGKNDSAAPLTPLITII